jgi:aminoglycoside phosphotransferase (APT) family kinase protein
VIPLVLCAGVPTPKLIRYDATLRVASLPYMVVQRVDGTTLAELAPDPAARQRILGSLGAILVTLHQIRFSKGRTRQRDPGALHLLAVTVAPRARGRGRNRHSPA